MTIDSIDYLAEILRQHQLLTPAQLEELAKDGQADGAVAAKLAASLVRRGWLTLYQAKQIFLGRADQLVLGQYLLLEPLGEGGMGQVFKARHRRLDRIDALKVIRSEYLVRPESLRRFQQEARAAARLFHPNIVLIYDADEAAGRHFLSMEYVNGSDLARLVRDSKSLPLAHACDYVAQTAQGLQHAHERGLVHRDIKPANLLLAADGGVVKILDMGLALLHQSADQALSGDLTKTGVVMGTPDYMAPEQALNSHEVDIRADIYSLGCTLYFLLTGQPPFASGSLTQKLLWHQQNEPPPVENLRPGLPPEVCRILRRMMAKRPEDRYQTPGEVTQALAPFAKDPGISVPDLANTPIVLEFNAPDPTDFLTSSAIPDGDTVAQRVAATPTVPPPSETLVLPSHPQQPRRPAPAKEKSRQQKRSKPSALKLVLLSTGICAFLGIVGLGWLAMHVLSGLADIQDGDSDKRAGSSRANDRQRLAGRDVGREANKKAGEVRRFLGHRDAVWSVAFSPGGKQILTGSGSVLQDGRWLPGDDHTVRLWDIDSGRELLRLEGHAKPVSSVAFSPDGRYALSASQDKTLRLWDLNSGAFVRQFNGHDEVVRSGAFSPDGRRIVSGGYDQAVRIWDTESGRQLADVQLPGEAVWSVAYSPDGQHILWGGGGTLRNGMIVQSRNREYKVCFADAASGQEQQRFVGHTKVITSVAMSTDGKRAISGSHDQTVRLWDVTQRAELHCLRGHTKAVTAVAMSKDGTRALSGSSDRSMRLWDAQTGQELHLFEGHTEVVTSVAFAPDNQHVLSGSVDGTVRLWRLPK